MIAKLPSGVVSVKYHGTSPRKFFALPLLKKAKKLVVRNMPGNQYFAHRRVADRLVVRFKNSDIGPMTLHTLIKTWIEEGRNPGTRHSWEMDTLDADELMEKLKTDYRIPGVAVYANKLYKPIVLEMTNGYDVQVSCVKSPKANSTGWIIEMRVL